MTKRPPIALFLLTILVLLIASYKPFYRTPSTQPSQAQMARPTTQQQWVQALHELPDVPAGGKIPAFFFGHGVRACFRSPPRWLCVTIVPLQSPMLLWPKNSPRPFDSDTQGPDGSLLRFLQDFGPWLLDKYKPKAIVVFSAHWETRYETLGTLLVSLMEAAAQRGGNSDGLRRRKSALHGLLDSTALGGWSQARQNYIDSIDYTRSS